MKHSKWLWLFGAVGLVAFVGGCSLTTDFEGSAGDSGSRCCSEECKAEEYYIFFEDFHEDDGRWDLGSGEWAIGFAQLATCSIGSDPQYDNTALRWDDGIAGAVLGGCIDVSTAHGFDCLTSPVINASALSEVWLIYDVWLGAEADDKMRHEVQIDDGAGFVTLADTPSQVSDDAWRTVAVDISAFKSATVQIRWCHEVTDATDISSVSGWNIDNVVIAPQEQCEPAPGSCGNNRLEYDDECDGTDLNGEDCTTVSGSYTGGTLSCNLDCTFDTTSCF